MIAWFVFGAGGASTTDVAAAAPSGAWAVDEGSRRVAIHDTDGSILILGQSGQVLRQLDGPPHLVRLDWRKETLVGSGPDGTFIWTLETGELAHAYAAYAQPALSRDGRYVATDQMVVEVGNPVPLARFDGEPVPFGPGLVASVIDGRPVIRRSSDDGEGRGKRGKRARKQRATRPGSCIPQRRSEHAAEAPCHEPW